MINLDIAETVAQEFCMPAYLKEGGCAVAFFKARQTDMELYIPTATDSEALKVATTFHELFFRVIERYQELTK